MNLTSICGYYITIKTPIPIDSENSTQVNNVVVISPIYNIRQISNGYLNGFLIIFIKAVDYSYSYPNE